MSYTSYGFGLCVIRVRNYGLRLLIHIADTGAAAAAAALVSWLLILILLLLLFRRAQYI